MTIPPPCQPSFYHHHHYTTQLNTLPTAASTQDIHQHPKTQQPVRLIKNQLGSSLLIFTFIITSSSSAVSASVLWHCFLADSNTLFTRWSWLDELALIEPAPHASFANVYRMLLTRWARQTTCSSQALVERSWSARRALHERFTMTIFPLLFGFTFYCKNGQKAFTSDHCRIDCYSTTSSTESETWTQGVGSKMAAGLRMLRSCRESDEDTVERRCFSRISANDTRRFPPTAAWYHYSFDTETRHNDAWSHQSLRNGSINVTISGLAS